MNGNCHLVFGAATGTAVCLLLKTDAATSSAIISTCLIGSLLPDIDNPESHIAKLTVPVSSLIGKISEAFGKTGWNHRGIFHSILPYILGLYLSFTRFRPILGLFIGALSHLFLDSFNPSGIPVLFGFKRLRFARIKSESVSGIILTWMFTFLIVLSAVYIRYIF